MIARIVVCDAATAPARAVVQTFHADTASGACHAAIETAGCIYAEYPNDGMAVEWWNDGPGGALWERHAYIPTPAQIAVRKQADAERSAALLESIRRRHELAEAAKKRKRMLPPEPKKPAGMYD